jgi:hypothetical protein
MMCNVVLAIGSLSLVLTCLSVVLCCGTDVLLAQRACVVHFDLLVTQAATIVDDTLE